jgi:hypothetical protein
MTRGYSIVPGTKISSGSIINLTVGDGGMSAIVEVPDLIGLTVGIAKEKLMELGLLVGNYSASANIQDTASSFIIGQDPTPYSMQLDSLGMPLKNKINPGSSINLIIDKVAPVRSQTDSIR